MKNKLFWFLLTIPFALLACALSTLPTQNATNAQTPTFPPFSSLANASKTPQGTVYVTAAETLYIRGNHSHHSEVVGHLIHGEQVTVYECFGLWARIGAGRWVNSNFLSEACK